MRFFSMVKWILSIKWFMGSYSVHEVPPGYEAVNKNDKQI